MNSMMGHANMPYNNMKLPLNNNMYNISTINNHYMRGDGNKDDLINGNVDNKSDQGGNEEESINNISSIMPVEEDANISELNYCHTDRDR